MKLYKMGLMALGLVLIFSCASQKALDTVGDLNIEQYLGTWYEIQRFPHAFEKNLQCVTATYSTRDDDKIAVLNKGFDSKAWKDAKGKAWVPDADKPGELRVQFFWPFAGDYYIIDTDPSSYALVGAPDRKYLWILSREKTLDKAIIDRLRNKAASLGFDISRLEVVAHDCMM